VTRVRRYALDAEDMVQEAFLAAFLSLHVRRER